MLIQLRTDPTGILLGGLLELDLEGKNTRNIKHMATGRGSELEPPDPPGIGKMRRNYNENYGKIQFILRK